MPSFVPVEILGVIISFIFDIESLFALRLVSRMWYNAVSRFDTHYLYVDLLSKNLDRFDDQVSKSKELNKLLRTLIWIIPDRPVSSYFGDPGTQIGNRMIMRDQMTRALDRMKKLSNSLKNCTLEDGAFPFSNLAHIAIHFRPPPVAGVQWVCSAYERSDHLKSTFKHIFAGFEGLHGLGELSILNIPIDLSIPGWTTIASVNTWMLVSRILSNFRLQTLRLSFLGPKVWQFKYSTDARELPIGSNHLLIKPVRFTLRHLSLSYWGFYMKNPPGAMALDIHLPLLESLELRSCGFTCNDTLNGIIKHGSTLLSLKFDDCAIIYCMELAVTSKAEPNSVCISTENEGGRVYQRYWLRWDIWFQALAYGLPHLKRFDFGSSRVRALGEEGPKFKSEASEGPKFGRVNKFLFGLFPDRYLEMKDGSVRAPWILKTRGQRPYYKEPPVADEPDLAMLRRLLEHTGQVVQENDKSSHASSVDSLIGCVETRSGRRRR